MSTKIYNGYIAKMNISDLLLKFKALVPQFEAIKKEGIAKVVIRRSVYGIDKETLNGVQVDQKQFIHDKFQKMDDEAYQDNLRNRRNPALDFSANVSVHFLTKRITLLLFYTEQKEFWDIWRNLDYIKEYHYQTDRPEKISAAEWNKRRKHWDIVLEDKPPIRTGYQFEFTSADFPWFSYLDGFDKHIPTLEHRAEKCLQDEWIKNKMHEIMVEKNLNQNDHVYTIYSEAEQRWKKFLGTEEFTKQLSEIKAKLPVIDFKEQIKKVEV